MLLCKNLSGRGDEYVADTGILRRNPDPDKPFIFRCYYAMLTVY